MKRFHLSSDLRRLLKPHFIFDVKSSSLSQSYGKNERIRSIENQSRILLGILILPEPDWVAMEYREKITHQWDVNKRGGIRVVKGEERHIKLFFFRTLSKVCRKEWLLTKRWTWLTTCQAGAKLWQNASKGHILYPRYIFNHISNLETFSKYKNPNGICRWLVADVLFTS